ncbi:MAG: nitroreductase [Mailhella sp.]|nr:nitroreductase [Mailhella sp.]
MKETLQDIKARRSCRKYLDQQISDEQLDAILEAGTWAATGMGMQSPIMIVVQDKPTLAKLSKLNGEVKGTTADMLYGAPTCVIVLADRNRPTCVEDGTLVLGNLMLAAHAVGVSSCWIHRAREVFDSEEGKAMLREWGVEGDYIGVGHCILGYAAENGVAPAKPRKENWIYRV